MVYCLWVYGLWTFWTIELRRVTLTMVMMTVLCTLLGDSEKKIDGNFCTAMHINLLWGSVEEENDGS